jgi:hypothetical protein
MTAAPGVRAAAPAVGAARRADTRGQGMGGLPADTDPAGARHRRPDGVRWRAPARNGDAERVSTPGTPDPEKLRHSLPTR